MVRKALLLLCAAAVSVSVAGCGGGAASGDAAAVKGAYEKLKAYTGVYEVSNVLQAPDGDLCYVEICKDGASYTEYPVDADGNYGTVAFKQGNGADYVLVDWLTSSGKGYTMDTDSTWAAYPDAYSAKLASRKVMYFDVLMDKLKDLKLKETVTVDIGMGDEEMSVYEAKVSGDVVRQVLGIGSEEIYKAVKDQTTDENIKALCGYYLEDIGFTMLFSESKVYIGVVDGMLRYLQIESGGLGSRLFSTKAVVLSSVDTRAEPDFSAAKDYSSTLKQMADYVASFDSYEKAMEAMSAMEEGTGVLDGTGEDNNAVDPETGENAPAEGSGDSSSGSTEATENVGDAESNAEVDTNSSTESTGSAE